MSQAVYLTLDPGWLRRQYHGEGRSLVEVARRAGCSPTAVLHAMKHHGIPRRAPGGGPRPQLGGARHLNPAWLVHKHHILGLSLVEMALEAGVSQPAISAAMKRRHIPVLHWRERQALRSRDGEDPVCNHTCPHWRDCLDKPEDPCPMP